MSNNTLQYLDLKKVYPNPENPRLIFNEKDLDDLKESIKVAGVLVPITVYQEKEDEYIILDGERRWRASIAIEKSPIPANVIDKPTDIAQNILQMFNIHYLREQWELYPTAAKLGELIKLLKNDKDTFLSKVTGLNLATVKRCKILLWFPAKYKEFMMYKQGKISTDFFIELHPILKRLKEEPEYNSDFKISMVIDGLINKFNSGEGISDVKEFREMRKAIKYYESKSQFPEFIDKLNSFINKPTTTIDIFTVSDLEIEKLKNSILKSITLLSTSFTEENIEIFSDDYIQESLNNLKSKLDEIILKMY
jgi:ParB family transcriptional regulator, chromosome partitioning protein